MKKKCKKKNETKYGKKTKGCSITDEPILVNIHPNEYSPYKNPIKIIDTAGFDDTRGIEYDEKIENDIKKILENSKIEYLNAVCLIFKGNETRAHERTRYILNKLFSLFGEDITKIIIIIFTFRYFR